MSLWGEDLEGAVVAIGNAPTALFALLELISDGGPKPAAIAGIPVGFVGSAESKLALNPNILSRFPTWSCTVVAAALRSARQP